jgi:hypothetical protein
MPEIDRENACVAAAGAGTAPVPVYMTFSDNASPPIVENATYTRFQTVTAFPEGTFDVPKGAGDMAWRGVAWHSMV